eukprot:5542143-Amphidinium_carterae.1
MASKEQRWQPRSTTHPTSRPSIGARGPYSTLYPCEGFFQLAEMANACLEGHQRRSASWGAGCSCWRDWVWQEYPAELYACRALAMRRQCAGSAQQGGIRISGTPHHRGHSAGECAILRRHGAGQI